MQPGVQRKRNSGDRSAKLSNPWQGVTENRIASKVTLIKGQTMRLQDNFELFEEGNASMMFFLSLDVTMDLGQQRFTHRECAVSFLPRKSCFVFEHSRNPTGRIGLQLTDGLRNCLVLPQFRQDVNVVGRSVDDHRDSSFIANRAAEISMRPGADLRRQPGLAVFRRKNDVIEQVTIGGTHSGGGFRRPSSGALLFLNYIPGVPLRSTPGFNSDAPSGCYRVLAAAGRLHDGAGCYPASWRMAIARALRSAPEARRNTARSAAQRNSGKLSPKIREPLPRGDGNRAAS